MPGQSLERGVAVPCPDRLEDGPVLGLGLLPHGGEMQADVPVHLLPKPGDVVERYVFDGNVSGTFASEQKNNKYDQKRYSDRKSVV